MTAIATLDTKTSLFFDHRDPNMVKMLGVASARLLAAEGAAVALGVHRAAALPAMPVSGSAAAGAAPSAPGEREVKPALILAPPWIDALDARQG